MLHQFLFALCNMGMSLWLWWRAGSPSWELWVLGGLGAASGALRKCFSFNSL